MLERYEHRHHGRQTVEMGHIIPIWALVYALPFALFGYFLGYLYRALQSRQEGGSVQETPEDELDD